MLKPESVPPGTRDPASAAPPEGVPAEARPAEGEGAAPAHGNRLAEGVFWVAVALGGFWLTTGFDEPNRMHALGSAFWPRLVLAGLLLSGLVLLASGLRERMKARAAGLAPHKGEPLSAKRIGFGTAVFGIPIVWAVAMHQMGFLLTMPVFLAVFAVVLGYRTPWKVATLVVGVTGVIAILFYNLLFTPLPQGAGIFNVINGYLTAILQ